MKTTQSLLKATALSISLLTATGANAALETRLGGLAVYDTDLNVTWLANAADLNGNGTWAQASAWVADLTVSGVSGWRLPITDPTCGNTSNCAGSEMGHLFYNELGGVAGQSITTTHNANYDLFQNFQSYFYWTGTEYQPINSYAYDFNFSNGYQNVLGKGNNFWTLAVHSGDVAAVPVPAAAWLLGSGLLGLIGVARRKAA